LRTISGRDRLSKLCADLEAGVVEDYNGGRPLDERVGPGGAVKALAEVLWEKAVSTPSANGTMLIEADNCLGKGKI